MCKEKYQELVEQQEHIVKKEKLTTEENFEYYLELGKESIRRKDSAHASEALRKAAQFRKTGELYLLLGVVHEDLHSFEKAAEYFKKGIDIDSRNPELFVELGTLYYKTGKKDAAEFYYGEALAIRPMNFSANFNMGIIHRDKGNWARAIEFLKKAELVSPNNFLTLYNLGFCYQQLGNSEKEAEYYRKSVHENPVSPEANFAYGNVLKEDKNWERAKEYYKASLRIKPDQPKVMTNLGIVYHYIGKFEESKELLESVIKLEPDNLDAIVNLAANYYELGDFEKSKKYYEKVLNKIPDDAVTHFNYSLLLFTIEEYDKALNEYEWRLKTWGKETALKDIPDWHGEELTGKRIFVIAEQGLGDAIQFVRYIKELKSRGAYVIMQARKPLVELFEESGIADEITPDIDEKQNADYKIHLMSIPSVIKKFPLEVEKPYIKVNSKKSKLSETASDKIKVGITWRGNSKHMYDFKRSVKLKYFKKLFVNQEAEFYSLQIDPTEDEKKILGEYGVADLSYELHSFLDTAQIINDLDLIISVDSAVAHLAGAMGKEVWLAISKVSDWRWGTSEGKTAWYKTMKLFRQQEPKEWGRVFERIGNKLKKKTDKAKRAVEQELALLKLYGVDAYEKGKLGQALIYFEKYLEKFPNDEAALLMAGTLEYKQKQFDSAEKFLRRLLKINPNSFDAIEMLSEIYFSKKDFKKAIEYCKMSLEIKETPEILNKLALSLQSLGRYEESEKYLRKVLKYEVVAGYYINYANTLYFLKRFDEAIQFFDKAIELENPVAAHVGKSFACLARKDFKNGFREYDWAIRSVSSLENPVREWDGKEASGKKILIYTEQGLGDSIQFMRFLPKVKEKGPKITVGTTPALAPFFENSPFVDKTTVRKEYDYDFSCSIMKLPKILGLEEEEDFRLPDNLFSIDENIYGQWKNTLSRNRTNVAVMWHTDSPTPTSGQRSVDFDSLQELFNNDDADFYLIEKNRDEKLSKELSKKFKNVIIINESLWNIASIVKAMDLVISIDSSILHIAASQKIPVWVPLPKYCDWRWTFEGENSYWYPSVKLFRQTEEGDWSDVIRKISGKLKEFVKGNKNNFDPLNEVLLTAENFISEGNFTGAEKLLDEFSEKYGDEEELNFKLGFVKQNQRKNEEALRYYGKVLRSNPANLNAINNAAVALKDLGKYKDAEKLLRISVEASPENFSAYNNLGIIVDATGRFGEAADLFRRALSIKPEYSDAEINLANTLSTLGRYEEALEVIDRLLEREPENVRANFNKSLLLFASGNYKDGFRFYEWRRKLPDYLKRDFSKPELNGEPVEGKKILLYDEQGYGDTIQFSRFVKKLADAGAEVILQTHGSLSGLMKGCGGVSQAIPRTSLDDKGIEYDFHLPLLSLPRYLGLGFEDCRMEKYYLNVESDKVKSFKEDYFSTDKIKVGLVWEGKTPLFNAHRSAKLSDFSSIVRLGGYEFYSLQVGDVAERDSAIMNEMGITDLSSAIKDFSDTAALLENLDFLISIDTAVAHLAGALNVKTFLLLSEKADWRWGRGERTIWYPSIKIFRQSRFGEWGGVINKVLEEMNPRNGVQTITNNKKRS